MRLWMSASLLLPMLACAPLPLPAPQPARIDSMPRLVKEGKVMPLVELARLLAQARSEDKPLKGYGLTVFEGTKIERFEIEIVDIARNYIYPKHDLILFRGSHKRWLDGGNIIAGMSGSPCYIDGKMIGALAYRLGAFQKDALGGITPIEYMVREMDRPVERSGRIRPATDPRGPVPVSTPIAVRGFSARTLDAFEPLLQRDNFLLAPSSGGSRVTQAKDDFEPGSPIGASLMTGDYDMTATGTVTFVDGDRILAFGHPFFGAGELELPITTCVVHTTFQGLSTAYKISSADKVVGALVHDRANAIFGRVGKSARMVPVTMTLRNPKVQTEQVVRVQCADHPTFLPMLVGMAHSEAVQAFEPSDNPHLSSSTVSVTLEGGRCLKYVDVEQSMGGGGFFRFMSLGGIMGKLQELAGNEYERPALQSIDIVTETVNENRSASLKAAWALPQEVEDGATVRIHVVLKRYRGPEVSREIELTLPKGLAKGTDVRIVVGGGSSIAPERAPASNLDDLIEALAKDYKSTSLVAVASVPSYSLMYHGRILEGMPNSALAVLVPTIDETAYLANASLRASVDTEWVIEGSTEVSVKIN
ncbi:MAG: hypothetical protein HYY16_15000 [Planctomycetes bacterium]|nr:hypothetical protein [Planctomycetota bacterium]